jgi:Fe-S-cluster-containing hydrogenase component 2
VLEDRGRLRTGALSPLQRPHVQGCLSHRAVLKDEKTGIVTIDQMPASVEPAPTRVRYRYSDGQGLKIMVKCDMCKGDPEYIKVCSSKAIKLTEQEQAEKLISEIEARPFVPPRHRSRGG